MTGQSDVPDPKGSVANRQPAKWLELDPPLDTPHRRDPTYATSKDEAGWHMVGASRRGRLHAHEGTFREDAFCIEHTSGWYVIAVADGAGSHSLSRVGSEEAVLASVAEMKARLETVGDHGSESAVRHALEEALRISWRALQTKAEELKKEFRDLGTTLLLLAYHPDNPWVGVAQIGDGLLAAQLEDCTIQLLGRPESGEYSGQTLFLTNHKEGELAARVDISELKNAVRLFLVMTDGVADDFYPPQERLPGLIKALPEVLANESRAASLLELINYERPGSFDDRTLVILCRQGGLLGSREPDTAAPYEGPTEPEVSSEVADDGSHPR